MLELEAFLLRILDWFFLAPRGSLLEWENSIFRDLLIRKENEAHKYILSALFGLEEFW